MKVEYMDDALSGRGHGFLILSNVSFPAAPLSFSFMRASDHQYATGKANAWTGEKSWMPIEAEPGSDGILQIPIGPELVDALNTQEVYAINLKGNDDKEFGGRLKIGNITYSADASLDNTDSSRAERLASEKQKQEEAAPDKDAAPPEKPLPAEEKPVLSEEQTPPLDMPEPEQKSSGKYWRWLILLLLVLGCLAWYFLDPRWRKEEGTTPQTPAPAAQEEARQEDVPGPKINFQGKNYSPAQAVELSAKLPRNTAAEKDALYRLYYFAANHDETGILFDYAACLDPSLPAWGTIGKDAPLAWSIYDKAKQVDRQKAEEAQNHLMNWLKENAANNRQAKTWLEEIGK